MKVDVTDYDLTQVVGVCLEWKEFRGRFKVYGERVYLVTESEPPIGSYYQYQ